MQPMDDLIFQQIPIGPMANFVYLIGSKSTREAAIVDPAWSADELARIAEQADLKVEHILVTHTHPDHVGGDLMGQEIEGLPAMLERWKAKVYIHKAEAELYKGVPKSEIVANDEHTEIVLGEVSIRFLHTPGHTPGSQCFMLSDRLVSGDTLFIGSCGRVDLPGSNPEDLYFSLTQKLMKLGDETAVFPGHNYAAHATSTTIGAEKGHNPFFNFSSKQDFLAAMGITG